jgi:hypothetical protein
MRSAAVRVVLRSQLLGTLAGRVAAAPTVVLPASLQVSARAVEPNEGWPTVRGAKVGLDGSFLIGGVRGRVVPVVGLSPESDLVIARVLQRDRDVSLEGVAVAPGDSQAELIVEVGRKTSQLRGVVGQLVRNRPALVLAFDADAAQRRDPLGRSVAVVWTDERGAFSLKMVGARRLHVVAFRSLPRGLQTSAAFLDWAAAAAVQSEVSPGTTRTVALSMLTELPPQWRDWGGALK